MLAYKENHVDTTSKDVVDNMEKGFLLFFLKDARHSLLDEVLHFLVVPFYAEECGGKEQELRAEEQHGVVNLSLRRKEEGGSPEKDCRAPG